MKCLTVLVSAGCLALFAGCSGSSSPGSSSGNDVRSASGRIDRSNPPVSGSSPPSVTLTAGSTLLDSGTATTLTWSSRNASQCTASGGWSGNRRPSGTTTSGALSNNTTFTLTCSGSGGSAMAMITVNVSGVLAVNWQAPTKNVDGTPLTDLAGYRIYYGQVSRNYTGAVPINNPATASASLAVPAGTYFVAMTAVDREGNESGYSNEVVKTAL